MKSYINLSFPFLLFAWASFLFIYQGDIQVINKLPIVCLVIFNSYFIGLYFIEFLIKKFHFKGEIVKNTAIFFGLVFLSPLLTFTKYIECEFILIGLSFLNAFFLWTNRTSLVMKWDVRTIIPAILATIVTIVGFANFTEILSPIPILYSDGFKDFYFFTAVTSSIRDFDFSTTIYEQNAGIYYHFLGFLPGASIAGLTNISTHVALWGISMPMLIFSSFISIHALLEQFITELRTRVVLISFLVFIFHFPLNPKCLFNGHFSEIVWFGSGHTLPVLPSWCAVYVVSILLFLVIQKITKTTLSSFLPIGILTTMLGLAKVTAVFVFYPVCIFYFLLSEKNIFSSKIIGLLVGLIPVILIILFYYSKASSKFVFEPGGYLISENLQTDIVNLNNFVKAILIALMIIIIWIGYKICILFLAPIRAKYFFMSLMLAFILCIIIQSVFKIKSYSSVGELLVDGSFDLLQFTRSVFIYFDLFGIVLLVVAIRQLDQLSLIYNRFVVFGSFVYAGFVFLIIVNNVPFYLQEGKIIKPRWAFEVVDELQLYRNDKKAIISDDHYSGQFIAAHDIGNFVVTIKSGCGGYTSTNNNYELYKGLSNFVAGKNPEFISIIKENKIKILIATPNTINNFRNLEMVKLIKRINNTKWLYSPIY